MHEQKDFDRIRFLEFCKHEGAKVGEHVSVVEMIANNISYYTNCDQTAAETIHSPYKSGELPVY